MIDYSSFIRFSNQNNLEKLTENITSYTRDGLSEKRYGDLPSWLNAMKALPYITPCNFNLTDEIRIGSQMDATDAQYTQLKKSFEELIPWRKGPFTLFGLHIDTEWHSDWKWDRLLPHIDSLKDKTVLDVGCGNGYHCLRVHGHKAKQVIGIDPSPRFIVQFYMVKKYLGEIPVDVLPIGIEELPRNLEAFDITFSMGVLYHRRSPMDHLRQLKDTLVSGGQLILETLVINGKEGDTLVPESRYAMMNNIWFIPSVATLESWLRKCGFKDVTTVDVSPTSTKEQRATDWMKFQSLSDFLDPQDDSKTVEGHPAPMRAIIIARKP